MREIALNVGTAEHAEAILKQLEDLSRSEADTSLIVERIAAELRELVETRMSPPERSDYARRLAAGEPIVGILKEISRTGTQEDL